jgi:hypothetical protein
MRHDPTRPDFVADAFRLTPNRNRIADAQRREDRIEDVATEVAGRAAAEIPPLPPIEWVVDLILVRPFRRDAEPQIPIDVFRHGVGTFGPFLVSVVYLRAHSRNAIP